MKGHLRGPRNLFHPNQRYESVSIPLRRKNIPTIFQFNGKLLTRDDISIIEHTNKGLRTTMLQEKLPQDYVHCNWRKFISHQDIVSETVFEN
jgi:hypothetical protein